MITEEQIRLLQGSTIFDEEPEEKLPAWPSGFLWYSALIIGAIAVVGFGYGIALAVQALAG
ncbi:hypothetical protein EN816_00715 [Mesorhizobium sp. M8A.F.Ca.ET.173.01.1.1]|nr:hypothetical protein EN816_00715 [Mesorhizobium sp. M8A.F.Ca.ET.173.01.1.1]